MAEIIKATGLAADEVRRLIRPSPIVCQPEPRSTCRFTSSEFGPDVASRRRPPSASYVTVLDAFMRLDPWRRTMGRSGFRARADGVQAPFQGNEHRRRPGHGDGARIRDGPGGEHQAQRCSPSIGTANASARCSSAVREREAMRHTASLRASTANVLTPSTQ